MRTSTLNSVQVRGTREDVAPAGIEWLMDQAEFGSDDADVVRSYVALLLRNGTLTVVSQPSTSRHVPAYVPEALANVGLTQYSPAEIWHRFTQETNLRTSPSGRCRSEVRRKARFLLWLKERGRAAQLLNSRSGAGLPTATQAA